MAIRLKNIGSKRKVSIGIAAVVFVAGFGVFQFISTNIAQAAARTWIGGGTTAVFSDPANWSGGTVPTNGDSIIMDEAVIPSDTETRLEVTNDIAGLELTGISFVNTNVDVNAFYLVGNAISIEGSIETDDTYVGTGNDMYLAVNHIAVDLTLTGPLVVEGVSIGDPLAGNDFNLGAFPLEIINKGDEAICAATGIVSNLTGSGAITVSASGEFNGTQLTGQNDGYVGLITVANGAGLAVGADSIRNVSMIHSEGVLTLVNYDYVSAGPAVIEAPMQLSGTLRAVGGASSHLGGCAGQSGDMNYVLSGGVELIGDLLYEGQPGFTVPIDTHIAAPYRPHQSTITTDATSPGVITTDAPILDVAPDAPTGLSATPSGTQIALSWTAPANNGGAAITDYIVEYKLAADTGWTVFDDGTSTGTSATVTGLPNSQVYDVRVSAVNVVGTGAAVTESDVVLVGVAGAPTGLSGTPSAGQVALSWTAPSNNGGSAITDYVVEYKLSADSAWTNFAHTASATTNRTVTGLANGASYDFRVATVNAQGQSGYATTNDTIPAVVAGVPTGLNGTPSAGQVALSWTAPSSNGGSAITDYLVQYKLNASGTWLTFAHTAATATNRTVTGLANGESYDFRVATVNGVGTSGYVTVTDIALAAVAPDAPTNLNVTPANSQAALSWTAPVDDGGAAITDYTIEYKLSTDSTWTNFAHTASAATGRTVTGLANGSTYDFRVLAINSEGSSSSVTETDVLIPAVVASAPTNLSATPANSQAALSWTAPANNGGAAITDYVVQYKLAADSTWSTFADGTSTTASTTVTGLANGSTYDFRVAAVNTAGAGGYVTEEDIVIPAVVANAPTNLGGTPSSGQVALTWTAPSSNGGSAVTDYVVEYKLSTDSTWTDVAHTASTATSRTVTGLANGSTYDFRVAAVNGVGQSPYVTTTDFTVPAVAASVPTSLSGTPSTGEVALTWTAPANDGGSAITDYAVEYKLSTDSTWTTFSDGAAATTGATVTGLGNGLSYDFRVAAENGAGLSGYAAVTGVTTPAVAPSTPLNLVTTPAVGEVLLDWDAPTSTGGATITDYTVEYKLSADSSWTAFAHTASGVTERLVTGLTNGETYDFRVSAVNTAGTGAQVSVANITVEASVASTPQNLSVTPLSEQAVLNWSAPATDGGSAITDYTIEYKLSSAGTWTTFAHTASTATTVTITGLVDDVLYDFRVAAVNNEGQSPFVTVSDIEVSAGTTVADAPTNLEAVVNGAQQIVLEWDAPVNNGGLPITEYIVGYKLSSDSTWQHVTVPVAEGTSYTFTTEITESGEYDFTVAAVNADGQGPVVSLESFAYTVADDSDDTGAGDSDAPGAPNTGAGPFASGDMTLILVNLLVASGLVGWFVVLAIRRNKKNSQE